MEKGIFKKSRINYIVTNGESYRKVYYKNESYLLKTYTGTSTWSYYDATLTPKKTFDGINGSTYSYSETTWRNVGINFYTIKYSYSSTYKYTVYSGAFTSKVYSSPGTFVATQFISTSTSTQSKRTSSISVKNNMASSVSYNIAVPFKSATGTRTGTSLKMTNYSTIAGYYSTKLSASTSSTSISSIMSNSKTGTSSGYIAAVAGTKSITGTYISRSTKRTIEYSSSTMKINTYIYRDILSTYVTSTAPISITKTSYYLDDVRLNYDEDCEWYFNHNSQYMEEDGCYEGLESFHWYEMGANSSLPVIWNSTAYYYDYTTGLYTATSATTTAYKTNSNYTGTYFYQALISNPTLNTIVYSMTNGGTTSSSASLMQTISKATTMNTSTMTLQTVYWLSKGTTSPSNETQMVTTYATYTY